MSAGMIAHATWQRPKNMRLVLDSRLRLPYTVTIPHGVPTGSRTNYSSQPNMFLVTPLTTPSRLHASALRLPTAARISLPALLPYLEASRC